MIEPTTAAIAFIVILLSLAVYLIAAREGRRITLKHPDDYFLARRRMSSEDLGDSQIAYALQMSTVYPFFVLAATGAWLVPVVNSFFWFVGIYLFFRWIPRFGNLLGNSKTIHAFVAQTNGTPATRQIASTLTIIAFAGVLIFEIVYGASVFRVLFGGNQIIYYVAIAALGAYLMSYIWFGGQTATMRTDQFQLILAYLGLHFSVAYLFGAQQVRASSLAVPVLPLLVLLVCVFMVWSRLKGLRHAYQARQLPMVFGYSIILLSVAAMMIGLARCPETFDAQAILALPSLSLGDSQLTFLLMIATAALLPLFWQFIDLSNWQRICSLTELDSAGFKKAARASFLSYMIESPLSWLLPVLLGFAARITIPKLLDSGDPFDNLIERLLSDPTLGKVAGIALCAGIVGIFMSTADSASTAIGYAFTYDLWKRSASLIDRPQALTPAETMSAVNAGRNFITMIGVIVIVGFVVLDWRLRAGQTLLGLLFAFYTPIIAFVPAVLCPVLIGRRPPGAFVILSMCTSAAAGIGLGIYSALGHGEAQWLPVPVTLATSCALYLLGLAVKRHRVVTDTTG